MLLRKILKIPSIIFYFLLGHIIGYLWYDRNYLTGKHFSRINGIGWRWVVDDFLGCKMMGVNQYPQKYWPISQYIRVARPENIEVHPDDIGVFQGMGNYYQAIGKITIGKGVYIAANVGLITANHNLYNLDSHDKPKPIILGDNCWIGMNSMILPGVCLGERTIVGAGSVVTKSFPQGKCVLAGNPARIIREL